MTDFYCPSCKTSWNGRYNTTHRCDTCNTPVRVKTAAPEATWISVEERLPDTETDTLLVCVKTLFEVEGDTIFSDTDGFEEGRFTFWGSHGPAAEVTHWMPLPAPPGGDR